MKKFKVSIPRRISYTECEVFFVEAETEQDAMNQVNESNEIGEFENNNDYETVEIYDMEVEEVKPMEAV